LFFFTFVFQFFLFFQITTCGSTVSKVQKWNYINEDAVDIKMEVPTISY